METKNILIVGVGGQGTLLTSRVLGNLAIRLGYDVKLSEVHGMSQRGGSVVTHVRYGNKVNSPLVEIGQADIVLAFEKLEAMRWKHFLKEDGILLVNLQEINPMPVITGSAKYPDHIMKDLKSDIKNVYGIDALGIARKLGNIRVMNTVLVGVLAKHMTIDKDQWTAIIESTVPKKTIEINLKAFEEGFDLGTKEVV